MSAQAGQVELQGSMSGPLVQWPLTPDHLRQALLEAGAPVDSLHLVTEGGWLTIEPPNQFFQTTAFSTEQPAQLLSQVLEQLRLSHGRAMDEEWVSTLRLVEYRENSKVEALIGLTQGGIQTVGRESAWKAVPPESELDLLRKYWKVALVLLFVIGGSLYLKRDSIMEAWNRSSLPSTENETETK